MNSVSPSSEPQQAGWSPSDDELISYLLGTDAEDGRVAMAAWLATDAAHGDRLSAFAAVIYFAAESVAVADDDAKANALKLTVAAAPSPRVRRLVGLLALAASIAVVLFSLRGFRADREADNRIALAWADALPAMNDGEPNNDIFDSLAAHSAAIDLADAGVDSDAVSDHVADAGDEFGFSAAEPPDWLLIAVSEMQASDTEIEAKEIVP